MSTVSTCTTSEDGWSLVSHLLGNRLLMIRMIMDQKKEGWEVSASNRKEALASDLLTIAGRMLAYGHPRSSESIYYLHLLVKELDLSNPAGIDAIHAKHHELSSTAREMKETMRKMSGK